jgi:hypothetical protein
VIGIARNLGRSGQLTRNVLPSLALGWLICGAPSTAAGQAAFVAGQTIPEMSTVICNRIEAARRVSETAATIPVEGCFQHSVRIQIERLETLIPQFTARFVYSFNHSSPQCIYHTWVGRTYCVPFSVDQQTSQFYYARLRVEDGREVMGWVLIPRDPYPFAYSRATGARILP